MIHAPSPGETANQLDRMRHPAEALATVLSMVQPLGIERVPLADAAWRILAADLIASEDHPPFPAATMDGFAVIAADGSPWREVIGQQPAGSALATEVTPGAAVKIMTGAPLPPGADAVVKVEATESVDDHVIIHQDDVHPGENVRPVGFDYHVGEHLAAAGSAIGPAEIGLLASLGIDQVEVRKRPKVTVISTGDELVEPGEPVTPGKIRDSNRFSLIAALQAEDVEITWAGKGPDERQALEAYLRRGITTSDMVITSGGVSMGELDLIKAILGDLATVHFRRVFMKPGKPLNFATSGSTLIFGLPGNPVSALVSFELFIRPALRRMAGRNDIERPRVQVTLTSDATPGDRIEFQRAIVTIGRDGLLTARTTGGQASSRVASLVGANALLMLLPRESPYRAGERVEALLTGPLTTTILSTPTLL